jgi:SET domain
MSGLAVLPANCITTTTEPGASHGAELHHPGPRPGRPDRHPLATGQARLNRSAQLTDATDDMIVTKVQLSAKLAESYPQVRLLATDNTALRLQDGRGRSLSPGRRGTLSRSRSSSGQPFLLHRDQRQPGRVHCRRQLLIQRHAGHALINHSCEPNVGFAGNTVLAAMRGISPGEELTTGYALFDDYDDMMRYQRGTPSCRATTGGQDWQRPDSQRNHGNYFSSYLLHRLARQPDRPG